VDDVKDLVRRGVAPRRNRDGRGREWSEGHHHGARGVEGGKGLLLDEIGRLFRAQGVGQGSAKRGKGAEPTAGPGYTIAREWVAESGLAL
jgi:hypothetical protein